VRHQFKSFVYVKDSVTEPLMAVYTRYFNTKGTTYRLSNWLSDYLDDPLRYLSTSSNNYKKLHIPVRLIWGEEDTITPPALTRVVLDSAPDSSLEVLPGVGHIPMVENPEVFQQALVEALGR
jgi:pimeloyl-ACP methyl ester carboxylesterase